ncbi:hypothetical protein Tco_1213532 [Tanacetum coccineum]
MTGVPRFDPQNTSCNRTRHTPQVMQKNADKAPERAKASGGDRLKVEVLMRIPLSLLGVIQWVSPDPNGKDDREKTAFHASQGPTPASDKDSNGEFSHQKNRKRIAVLPRAKSNFKTMALFTDGSYAWKGRAGPHLSLTGRMDSYALRLNSQQRTMRRRYEALITGLRIELGKFIIFEFYLREGFVLCTVILEGECGLPFCSQPICWANMWPKEDNMIQSFDKDQVANQALIDSH